MIEGEVLTEFGTTSDSEQQTMPAYSFSCNRYTIFINKM